jgi:DNA-binding MurR/RpiR family transcriptional regulator
MTPSKLRMAVALMADPHGTAQEVAAHLGIGTSTLCRYVDGNGVPL